MFNKEEINNLKGEIMLLDFEQAEINESLVVTMETLKMLLDHLGLHVETVEEHKKLVKNKKS